MSAEYRHGLNGVLCSLVVLLFLGPARLLAEEGIAGEWELKVDRNGVETFSSLTIQKKTDGTLEGKWGSTPITDLKFQDGKLTFGRTLKFGDREFKMTYEGTLKDGKLSGNITGERGTFSASGTRRKPRNPALGRWEINFRIAERDINAVLAISAAADGALSGQWTSTTGEHVVKDLKFEDGKLSFSRKSKIGEREFESTYLGTIQGSRLNGTIKSQIGDIEANGKRVGGDLVGKWELTSTGGEQGPRTSLLNVFGDLTGRYELFGAESPIKDLKLEGDQVTFQVEVRFRDQTSTVDFKGKLEGGKNLKGEVTSPRGTRQVTGKKLEEAAPSPLVGVWEITRESQQGPRKTTLTIKEDLSGTYTSRDSTSPISDLHLEGDQLSFKVTVKYGDREVLQEFKGKLEGAALKGAFTTPRGSREATGKKITSTSL
jgi:hypothetical protein